MASYSTGMGRAMRPRQLLCLPKFTGLIQVQMLSLNEVFLPMVSSAYNCFKSERCEPYQNFKYVVLKIETLILANKCL